MTEEPYKPNAVIITLPGQPVQHVVLQSVDHWKVVDEGLETERLVVYRLPSETEQGSELARYRKDGWCGIRWVRLQAAAPEPTSYPGEIIVEHMRGVPKPQSLEMQLPAWAPEIVKTR